MKNKRTHVRILSLCLAFACLLGLAAPAMAAEDVGATANAGKAPVPGQAEVNVTAVEGQAQVRENAYVYEKPGQGRRIVMLSENIVVTLLGESGSYYQISYTNRAGKTYTGFMEKSKLGPVDGELQRKGAEAAGNVTSTIPSAPTGNSQSSSSAAGSISAAKKTNSDTIGYISIAGTNISRPILYRSGNVHYYSNYNIDGKKDNAGEVYAFYGSSYKNNTITGHNMRGSNRLFHQLHHLQEKALGYSQCQHSKCPARDLSGTPDLRVASNKVWDISLYGYSKWEVFAMYEVKKNEPKSTLNYNIYPLTTEKETQAWLDTQLSRSEINFGTKVSTSDKFLTIYTCGTEYDSSSAQSRLYFFLKAVS